jgi:hypothetical protein
MLMPSSAPPRKSVSTGRISRKLLGNRSSQSRSSSDVALNRYRSPQATYFLSCSANSIACASIRS